jgi:hypothetical protein
MLLIGLFAVGLALFLFYEYNRRTEARQDERREQLNERRQKYLQKLLEVKKKQQDTTQDPPTN